MKNIDCILLVDDSKATNIYNKKVIEKNNIEASIYEASNGLEALDYLRHKGKFTTLPEQSEYPRPNIIFLDINMPMMDGFEFLEHYVQLSESERADMLIVFLTTSNWVKDRVKALDTRLIHDYLEKPLDQLQLQRVLHRYQEKFGIH